MGLLVICFLLGGLAVCAFIVRAEGRENMRRLDELLDEES